MLSMKIKRENQGEEDEKEDARVRFERAANPDEYGRKVSKMAVAQICEAIGFDSVKQSSLQALSEIALRFISDLGKSSNFYANLAGRSQSNVFDILKASEDLSGVYSSTSDFAEQREQLEEVEMEIPFANPIPRFPVITSRMIENQSPSFSQMGETKSKHIPDWLPAFPDEHTYISSPLWSQRKFDLRIDKGEQARQRRKAERSLLNLQQRLLSNASGCGSDQGLEVAAVVPPAKGKGNNNNNKDVLVKQMFAPAIEALKGGGTQEVSDVDPNVDGMDVDRRLRLRRRQPVVQFKLRAGKKMVVEDLDVYLRSKVVERRSSLFGREDDKDDKKRRAELILRQSAMDHQPQEVSQM